MKIIETIPQEMEAVFLEKPGLFPVVRKVTIPVPGPGEVLVKMSAAPVNPSDLARIRNAHKEHDLSIFIPGLEGSGTVVSAGKGLLPGLWLGKRVTCSSDRYTSGTWAEYMVTSASKCFPLGRNISFEQGSMSLVNPLTALEFFEIIRKNHHRAIISNAAASALGRMIVLLGKKNNIPVINIVRRQELVEELKARGNSHVLNSTDPLFSDQLRTLSGSLRATILFDPVCDPGLKEMVKALPYGSEVVIYGNLTGSETIMLSPANLIAGNISISGFYLGNKSKENGLFRNMLNLFKVRRLMRSEMKINIRETFPLNAVASAVESYVADMSAGKVILVPGKNI